MGRLKDLHYIYTTTIKHRITAYYKRKSTLAYYLADEKHFGAWGEVTPSPKTTPQTSLPRSSEGVKDSPPLGEVEGLHIVCLLG